MSRARIAAQELRLRRCSELGPVYFHGETMRPFLGEGDLVVIEPVDWDDIAVGDIITYRFEDKFPTRRVVQIDRRREHLILRGDSIPGRPDYAVRRADVLGRARARIRDGVRVRADDPEWRDATRRAMWIERRSRWTRMVMWPVRGPLRVFRAILTAR